MADLIDLEARISALEMIVTSHLLQSGVSSIGFDPTAFAASRRDAWIAVGQAVCESCGSDAEETRFATAYSDALERLGHLLVVLAEPVQEAVDETWKQASGSADGSGSSIEDASREAVMELERRQAAGIPTAGAGDIG